MAVKAHFGDGPWTDWEPDIRMHREDALLRYAELLREDVEYQYFVQYVFHEQWQRLREYAAKQDIRIIGDIPIYVPLDSADVWSNPESFQLTRSRKPRVVAGCPPDGFNRNGQYWGNPIYDWDKMASDGFAWWLRRIGAAAEKFDVVRIDHFRGLESYWSIPAANSTARCGQWVKGPGLGFVSAIRKNFPGTDFIAEDLGFLTPEVHALVEASGFPGMKDDFVSVEHLLLALIETADPTLKSLFGTYNITKERCLQALQTIRGSQRVTTDTPEDTYEALTKYGTDLVKQAREQKMDPVIGRDDEIRNVIRILSRKTKNNPVLIGEPGVGKTAIAEGLAQRIVRKDVPKSLQEKTIFSLDMRHRDTMTTSWLTGSGSSRRKSR